ncbi:carbohydrate ABC transporter permease [Bifidobacterium sp. ESL0820]|uniref:carbohydrate ABC transporter permease n=1 Tax=Bifidobacterium sp. ESL0820 TaxID=3448586 RepID=UPI004040F82F
MTATAASVGRESGTNLPENRSIEDRWSVSRIFKHVVLILAAASIAIPTIWVIFASFKQKSEFYRNPWALPKGLFLQNYVDAFVDAHMGQYFINSILVTAMAMILSMAIALPAAYVLARFEFPGRTLLNLCIQGGLFINVNYIVVPIFLMLVGWDKALVAIFPGGFFINNIFVLAVVYAATSLPFCIYLLEDYFAAIPKDYEEAAEIDGASHFTVMVKIFFPMAAPAISTALLFNFLSFWNDYIISLTLMTGKQKTLQVGLLNLMTAQKAAANYGRLYAGMVIVMVPVLIFYAVIQKKLLESNTQGGIK